MKRIFWACWLTVACGAAATLLLSSPLPPLSPHVKSASIARLAAGLIHDGVSRTLAERLAVSGLTAAFGSLPATASSAPKARRIADAAAAVQAALEDLSSLPPSERSSQSYIWIPAWMPPESLKIVSGALNLALSRSEAIYRPIALRLKLGGFILRYDARMLTNTTEELRNLESVRASLSIHEPYLHANRDGVIAFGYHTGSQAMSELAQQTESAIPLVRADWFIRYAVSNLDGGRYYDFQAIERKPKKGTAEQAWYDSLGAREADLNATQRSLIDRSAVTGKQRRIDCLPQLRIRPGAAAGTLFVTHDISNEQQAQAASDPAANLIKLEDAAREAIAFKTNGLCQFALFKADGSLQDSAPENVVVDHLIPAPHTRQLQAAIGCIRCHGGQDGYHAIHNDAANLFGGRLTNFGDLSLAKQLDVRAQIQLLAGLYAGRPDKPLNRARDDYSEAVWAATGGLSVPEFSAGVARIFGDYSYLQVTPRQALLEVGWDVGEADAPALIRNLVADLAPEHGISPEDAAIGTLKEGGSISRPRWERCFADFSYRAYQQN